MPFAPTITHKSASHPGVKFTVHRIGLGRRTDIEFQVLKHSQRMRELEAETPPVTDQERELRDKLAMAYRKTVAMLEAAKALPADQIPAALKAHNDAVALDVKPLEKELRESIPVQVARARAVIDEEYNAIDSRIKAEWIRSGLISIEGDGMDGMTAEQLLEYGPPDLAIEIHKALVDDGRLRGADTRNFQSPGTTSNPAAAESRNGTAEGAEVPLAATT